MSEPTTAAAHNLEHGSDVIKVTTPASAAHRNIPYDCCTCPDRLRQALTYISSPTMGLPSGRDALDFVDEASETNVRLALKACITTARAALSEDFRG